MGNGIPLACSKLGGSAAVSLSSFIFYFQLSHIMSEEVIILDSLRIGSISLLAGYPCIPWCELPIWNINEKSSYLLFAHLI